MDSDDKKEKEKFYIAESEFTSSEDEHTMEEESQPRCSSSESDNFEKIESADPDDQVNSSILISKR